MSPTSALCGMSGTSSGTEITNWNITQTIDVQDATSMSSDGWMERIGCLLGATGTFKSIAAAIAVGPSTGTFTTPTYSISGAIIIEKVTVDTDVNGLITYTHNFRFTGPITAG